MGVGAGGRGCDLVGEGFGVIWWERVLVGDGAGVIWLERVLV